LTDAQRAATGTLLEDALNAAETIKAAQLQQKKQ
jgi:hypothetical protein